MDKNITFSVVGLGKLGASMAAGIASRGFEVIGVDINPKVVELINQGLAPVQETKLEEYISASRGRLRATTDYHEAILNSDLTFVVVNTPSDDQGAFSIKFAAQAFKEIGLALKEKNKYHNVVLVSTVLPGSTRYGLLPILEGASGKVCGKDFGLCYSPEFIALGSVIHDFLNPDLVLIGEFDEYCGSQLASCYAQIMENNPPCVRMSIENAELTKIALNAFVTMKITFANILADLCERIPGGDVDVVTKALGFDKRIGHKYLKGALGYGGPCFPRDNIAFSFIAKFLGSSGELAETTDRINRAIPARIVERVRPFVNRGTTVAILGLAYKPFTPVIEESQSIYIAMKLRELGAQIIAYDPNIRDQIGSWLKVVDSLEECLKQADIIVIANPDPEFRELKFDSFANNHKIIVVDCWRILDKKIAEHPNIYYIPIGCSIDDQENEKRLAELWKRKLKEIGYE
jgi:UDPglucose 6-dehydrogenase